jgi:hypothetical protein
MDNSKTDLQVTGWDDMNRINLAQDMDKWGAFVTTVMNLSCTLLDRVDERDRFL